MTNGTDIAHPIIEQHGDGSWQTHVGMTKREYFAATALQGILSMSQKWPINGIEVAAKNAVKLSDALIKALNESNDCTNNTQP